MGQRFYSAGSVYKDMSERILLSVENLYIFLIEYVLDRSLKPVEMIIERT